MIEHFLFEMLNACNNTVGQGSPSPLVYGTVPARTSGRQAHKIPFAHAQNQEPSPPSPVTAVCRRRQSSDPERMGTTSVRYTIAYLLVGSAGGSSNFSLGLNSELQLPPCMVFPLTIIQIFQMLIQCGERENFHAICGLDNLF